MSLIMCIHNVERKVQQQEKVSECSMTKMHHQSELFPARFADAAQWQFIAAQILHTRHAYFTLSMSLEHRKLKKAKTSWLRSNAAGGYELQYFLQCSCTFSLLLKGYSFIYRKQVLLSISLPLFLNMSYLSYSVLESWIFKNVLWLAR